MCGLFGWSFTKKTDLPDGKREVMAGVLAISNSLRGNHAWGFVARTREGKARIRRGLGDISHVTGISAYGRFPMLMGHTRYATVGDNTIGNTHPFRLGKVTLAHNGGIWNHEELNKKYDRKCSVDSQHLLYHLVEGKDFSELEGYGAIEWIEDDSDRVFLCRLKGGSLSTYGIEGSKDKTIGVVWSSDSDHLRSAMGQSRLDCFPYKVMEEGCVYFIENGKMYEDGRKLDLDQKSRGRIWRGHSRDDWGEGWGWRGGAQTHITYSSDHYLDYKCEKCEHWHDMTGKKCLRNTCQCKEDTLEARKKRLEGEDRKWMAKYGYWECNTCNHFHNSTPGSGCLRHDCFCKEKTPEKKQDDKKDELVVYSGKTEKGDMAQVVSIDPKKEEKGIVVYTRRHGKLTKMDVDCYISETGNVVTLDEIEDDVWKVEASAS